MNKQSELTAADFGDSPFARDLKALREKAARDNPKPKPKPKPRGSIGSGNPFKRDILGIEEDPSLKARGLMVGWVDVRDVEDYLLRGAKLATHRDCGMKADNLGHRKGEGMTGQIRRGSSVAIVQPISWTADRIAYESELAQAQLGAAARVPGTTGNAGFFGSQPLRPDLPAEEPDEDSIDDIDSALADAERAASDTE